MNEIFGSVDHCKNSKTDKLKIRTKIHAISIDYVKRIFRLCYYKILIRLWYNKKI